MRALIAALAFGIVGAVLLPAQQARAWWDGYHRWHGGYWRPGFVVVAPPPPVYAVPYARWIPPHYNRFGYFVPGHWA
jgi:hypothetical protein